MKLRQVVRSPDYLRNIQVLVADNDPKILELMAHVLNSLGFPIVFTAQDGYEAVNIIRTNRIDLILTDWELSPQQDYSLVPPNPVVQSEAWAPVPPSDGAHFIQYLRVSKYSPSPYVPAIMMIGMGLKNSIEYARDAGVNEILLKPFSVEDLCSRIVRIIDNPRTFVTSKGYRGPCRRTHSIPHQAPERRRSDVRVFKHAS